MSVGLWGDFSHVVGFLLLELGCWNSVGGVGVCELGDSFWEVRVGSWGVRGSASWRCREELGMVDRLIWCRDLTSCTVGLAVCRKRNGCLVSQVRAGLAQALVNLEEYAMLCWGVVDLGCCY
jgi:hypothetical protein